MQVRFSHYETHIDQEIGGVNAPKFAVHQQDIDIDISFFFFFVDKHNVASLRS